jgi:hypothetical protein
MESQPNGRAAPLLEEATGTLRRALADACAAEVQNADTGELVRIEKALVLAADAAERALSIRRQVKRSGARKSIGTPAPALDLPVEPADSHRVFVDAAGVRWDAFAVHPSAETTGKARLPEPYQNGWLSFDSGTERRRLSPIPENWQALSDDDLREACSRAEQAGRRQREARPIEPPTGQ